MSLKIFEKSSEVIAWTVEERCGSWYSASVASVRGSSSLTLKPPKVPHTVTSRPAESKVAVAHSPPRAAIFSLVTCGFLPSGPDQGEVALPAASECMPLRPLGARKGCCGGASPGSGTAVAGPPS